MNSSTIKKTLVLVMILAIIPVSFSMASVVNNSLTCGVAVAILEFEDLSAISMDTIEYDFNEAKGYLAQGKCSDLKPDYCGMGACKDGWKCKANVNACMCFPPN